MKWEVACFALSVHPENHAVIRQNDVSPGKWYALTTPLPGDTSWQKKYSTKRKAAQAKLRKLRRQ
ncbi:MAG: hypothetical protein ACOYL7_12520, partial [Caldilinea sp.]